MNFKLTKLKTIISLTVSILIGIWFFSWLPCFDCPAEMMLRVSNFNFLMGFLGSIFLIYFIWSLFQKDNKKRGILFYLFGIIIIFIIDLLILFIISSLEKFF